MNVSSKDLCQELYELSGWDDCDRHYYRVPSGPDVLSDSIGKFYPEEGYDYPAYDLGYLLRKLPYGLIIYKGKKGYSVGSGNTAHLGEIATHHLLRFSRFCADIPEDAACKLAIELFKAGILKRETQS